MAFLRIVRNHIDPSKYDALVAEVGPTIQQRENESAGLRYRFVARDPATGVGMIATVWDTREQAEAGVAVPDELRAKMDALLYTHEPAVVAEITHEFIKAEAAAPA